MKSLLKPTSLSPKFGKQIPLPIVLVVPFALQVFTAVGLIGFLSFKNGQKAVNDLAHQLMDKAGQQVDGHLDNYLALPQELVQVSRDAIASKQINLNDPNANEQYFWQQAKAFKNLSYIGYLLEDGREVGAGRWLDGKTLLIYENLAANHQASDYLADQNGRKAKLLQSYTNDAWTLSANAEGRKAKGSIWGQIYTFDTTTVQISDAAQSLQTQSSTSNVGYQNYVSLPARSPIYDQNGKFVGIVLIDLLLTQISEFLSELKVSPSGQVFIMERNGMLVGSSSTHPILHQVNQKTERISALTSPDPLIQNVAQQLKKQFAFQNIQSSQALDFNINGENHFVQVTPWKDAYGIDWLIVVSVPESDFMAQINANTRTTIGLCLTALGIASLLGYLTSRWISKPILKLSQASEALAAASQSGFNSVNLAQHISATGIHELDTVGRSFNHMAEQLQKTVVELAENNAELENRVESRTSELSQALTHLRNTQAQMVQSEKMSALGQMVAGVAHEINNPVNFIHGNLSYVDTYMADLMRLMQLYQKHYPTPPAEISNELEEVDIAFLEEDLGKLLASMRVGTDRIREIVLSLRNFSRLDESDSKRVDIHEGIDNTLTILQNRLKTKPNHPAIEVVKEYDKLPLVECYPGQLNQVFMNILGNAIDALEEQNKNKTTEEIKSNPSKICIRTELSSQNSITIKISDNGSGMSEQVRSNVFNPFFTTKAVGKGTGLGLSISYQIVVDKHQGKLWCDSTPGQGTTFAIEIPIKQDLKESENQGTNTRPLSVIHA
jgi:signal transduction histidine kinase